MNALVRRRWVNLGLLALAGGLAALALFESSREPPAIPPLLGMPIERIERIEVLRPAQEPLAFQRQDGRWRMIAPDSGWANSVLMNRLLEVAAVRCPLQYPVAGLDLPALHLEPPQLQLRLGDREIRFGATAPTAADLRYLQVDVTVHLCPDRVYPLLTSAAASFLAPAIESPKSSTTKAE